MTLLRRIPRRIWWLIVLAFLAWVGFEIGRAGNDGPQGFAAVPFSELRHGTVSGRRIDGRAWSLDYDTAKMSANDTQATIAHVHDGLIHRKGKPDVHMQADDVTVNTLTNDLEVHGPVTFTDPGGNGAPKRSFTTVGAHYTGFNKRLVLDHQATISEGHTTVTVSKMTIDFATGDATMGRIVGNGTGT